MSAVEIQQWFDEHSFNSLRLECGKKCKCSMLLLFRMVLPLILPPIELNRAF
jgi:hypothetical protein